MMLIFELISYDKEIQLTIGILSIAPYLDNTDRNPWFEDDTFIVSVDDGKINRIRRSDPDWKPQSEFEEYHEQIYQEQERQSKEQMKEFLESTANVCTNGKDPSQLSLSMSTCYLGIMNLQQQQFYKLKLIVKHCKQKDQISSKIVVGKHAIMDEIHKQSIYNCNENKKSKCFGDFIELYYDKSKKDPKESYSAAPGISITWHENTPQFADAECGTTAIQELSTDQIIKSSMCDTKGYHTFSDALKNMGYIPVDWQNYIYIFGHSLGSLYATEAIYNMTPEEKQKVAGIVTMVGPLLWATKSFKPQVGGDDCYMFKVLSIDAGINWYAQRKMSSTSSSVVDLYPKDTYFRFRSETWMQQILDRIKWDILLLDHI
ncbi:unnamed protein product [Paramecium octaurelia]|uniref:Uncharacterized protein n=1 Tax=Paramecium octaurelia TaxID=43137 RepID=A0A8S1SXC8_PAROT|nr:unnamed protein product [Paramecium octaurelia]